MKSIYLCFWNDIYYLNETIVDVQGQMGNSALQNVRKRCPITNQASGNYVTSTLDIILIIFLQISVIFRLFVFS